MRIQKIGGICWEISWIITITEARTEQKQSKHVLNRQRNVAENLLQLNFTPANEEHEEYKGERYEVKIAMHCFVKRNY